MTGEQKHKKKTNWREVGTTIFFRASAITFWLYVISHDNLAPILPKALQPYALSPDYVFERWAALAITCILIPIAFKLKGLWYLSYVLVFFPLFVFPFLCVYSVFISARTIYRTATSLMAPATAIACTTITAIGWIVIPRMSSFVCLKYAIWIWGDIAFISLLALCALCLNPLKPALRFIRWGADGWAGFIQKTFIDPLMNSKQEERAQKMTAARSPVDSFEKTASFFESKLLPKLEELAVHRFSLIVFFLVFSALVVSIIADYAVGYYTLSRLDVGAFHVDHGAQTLSLPEAFYLSISTLTTSGVSEYRHHSVLAKVLCASEVIFGFVLLSLLVSGFSLTSESESAGLKTGVQSQVAECKNKIALWRAAMVEPTPTTVINAPPSYAPPPQQLPPPRSGT